MSDYIQGYAQSTFESQRLIFDLAEYKSKIE
jgi:hypothetical protein